MQIFEDELMQSQRNYNAVLHAAHLLLKSHPSAAEMFACSLGKTPNTVRNELNPNLPNYKLGLIDAVEMMNCTECFSLLFQINAMCGFVAVPVDLSEKPTERVLDKFCQWQAAVGRTCQSIYDAIEDDVITPTELNAITSAGNKKMAQWFGVQVALQQEAERNHVSRT
ncbi:phage regulatory CII family protein [uncultured Alteromonas sp.]|jgi:hypothetical protein|uniref:phage regulatory CII family protein n=1 Tax=uncultured Alteromonas sp. TaxID=179113 RepID=UPI002585480D|nr:phage regulatory CII family protein [uncultured Alteromonas sp.]